MKQSPNVLGIALGCKSFHEVSFILVCIELIYRLRKGRMDDGAGKGLTAAAQFSSLVTVHNAIRSISRSVSKVEGGRHVHEETLLRLTVFAGD